MATTLQRPELIAHQAQIEGWRCERAHCTAALRLPTHVPASRLGDVSAAAGIMAAMREDLAGSGTQVALAKVEPQAEGMSIVLQLSSPETVRGRFMTEQDIAQLRHDTLQAHLAAQVAAASASIPR